MMKHRAVHAIAVLTLIVAILGCPATSGDNEYAAATQQYNATTLAYNTAQDAILAAGTAGKITAAQHVRFNGLQAAYGVANSNMHDALTAWHATGAKPATFDATVAALTAAKDAVVAFQHEVTK